MRITVTAEDIAAAERARKFGGLAYSGTHQCPIAQAIKRVCPELSFAVLSEGVEVFGLEGRYFLLPSAARDFITDFDNHADVMSFEFELPGFEC